MGSLIKILLAAILTAFTGRIAHRLEAAPKKSTVIVSPSGFSFDTAGGVSNRFITPNGDRLNDVVVFTVNNPRDSEVTGTIYDLKGSEVARMTAGPTSASLPADAETLMWDGKMGGQPVSGGIYIYLLKSEDTVVSGTVVVVR
jgi:hypothetical protein